MIKNFIFDCAGVLIGFSRDLVSKAFVTTGEEDRKLVNEKVFEEWVLQDEGMPSLEYVELVKTKLPERLWEPATNMILRWRELIWDIPGMCDAIKYLKSKGMKLILLSNMPDNFSINHEGVEAFDYFDDLLFSFNIGLAKPYKEIFEYTLNKHSLNPEETMFVDDTVMNLDTAKGLGINTFYFKQNDPTEFIEYIHKNF